MQAVHALGIISETPLRLNWIVVSGGDGEKIGQQIGTTTDFEPLVYAGTLNPYAGLRVAVDPGDGRDIIECVVVSVPPDGWTGRALRLRERIAEIKASGLSLPGFNGHDEWMNTQGPFAQAGKIAADQAAMFRGIAAGVARVEAKVDQLLARPGK